MKTITHAVSICAALCLSGLGTTEARADLQNCENLYVGVIHMEKGISLQGAVFLSDPGNSSGSYLVFFNNWTPEEKKGLLALLLSAKAMQHRVHIQTEEANSCGITTGWRQLKNISLANNP